MDQLILISLVILGLPLLSFVLVIFNQRQLGEHAYLIATPAIAFSATLAGYVAWMRLHTSFAPALQWGFDWLHFGTVPGIGTLIIRQNIYLDNMTAILHGRRDGNKLPRPYLFDRIHEAQPALCQILCISGAFYVCNAWYCASPVIFFSFISFGN